MQCKRLEAPSKRRGQNKNFSAFSASQEVGESGVTRPDLIWGPVSCRALQKTRPAEAERRVPTKIRDQAPLIRCQVEMVRDRGNRFMNPKLGRARSAWRHGTLTEHDAGWQEKAAAAV
jgi:hypothetical protein